MGGCLIGKLHPMALRPYESLYNWLVAQSRRTGKTCTISYRQFVEFTKVSTCYYCGEKVQWTKFNINKNGSHYNLDRKDSSKGYSKKNSLVCCSICNGMKSALDYEEFLLKVKQIGRKHGFNKPFSHTRRNSSGKSSRG